MANINFFFFCIQYTHTAIPTVSITMAGSQWRSTRHPQQRQQSENINIYCVHGLTYSNGGKLHVPPNISICSFSYHGIYTYICVFKKKSCRFYAPLGCPHIGRCITIDVEQRLKRDFIFISTYLIIYHAMLFKFPLKCCMIYSISTLFYFSPYCT